MTRLGFHAIVRAGSPQRARWNSVLRRGLGDVGMRPSWWAFILIGFLTCSVTYQLTHHSSLPNQLPAGSDESKPQPLDQKSDRPLIDKDKARLPEGDSSAAVLKPDQLPVAQDQAAPEDAAGTGAIEFSNSNYI